jgi:hypothetical protein
VVAVRVSKEVSGTDDIDDPFDLNR